jgi:hypothetical protein
MNFEVPNQVNIPSSPSGLPLRQWGFVPSVFVLLGLPIALMGAFGEISFSNRKLMLGALLLMFAAAWRYARQAINQRSLLEAMKCGLFVALTAAFSYALVWGKLPGRLPH